MNAKYKNGIMVATITHRELDNLAAEYEQRLREQGLSVHDFSKYDFIAGVLAGGKFALGQENFTYDPR